MAQTPSTSRLNSGKQTGSAPGQAINEVTQVAPGGYNVFPKPWNNFITPKFAEITPFFFTDTVGKSKELLINTHEVRSYTMSAPNMQEIRMHKSYYSVPKEAIMPRAWQYWFKNPKQGDDVPPDTCYPGISVSALKVLTSNFLSVLRSYFTKDSLTELEVNNFFRIVGFLNLFYSNDSLLALLGCPLSSFLYVSSSSGDFRSVSFDYFVEMLIESFAEPVDGRYTAYSITDGYNYSKTANKESLNYFSDVREVFLTLLTDADYMLAPTTHIEVGKALVSFFDKFTSESLTLIFFVENVDGFISFDMAKAYQMTCAQFFSNSDIDDIYDYKLWEDNALSLESSLGVDRPISFVYNGITVYLDSYSQSMCDYVAESGEVDSLFIFRYFSNLLCIRKSLIYQDYFYGSRLNPLAVGDVDAQVNENKVSAIDVTKSIVMQRFLNAVNKIPGDILSYLKGIFGYQPLRIPPQPIFLAQDTFSVNGELVNNTSSENQGNLVKNISFKDSDRGYEVYNDCESFIFGFVWFDFVPVYIYAADRLRLMNDRFDFFQPYMQTIGDQPVLMSELSPYFSSSRTFSWHVRNMEYKQRFSRKSGGFVRSLPSWTLSPLPVLVKLSPNAIRNENRFIDSLFSSLTGAAMDSYFHFIMSNHNQQISNLPMLRQPGIL